MAVRVAVDAMGGDHAPAAVVEGAVQAVREAAGSLVAVLVGPEADIQAELAKHDVAGLPIQVVHAPEVIGMGEAPATALKSKPQSSIHLGLGLHKQGHVEAFVSAGNTGAVMAAALFLVGRLPGVLRPTLPGYFPTTQGVAIVLDVGANVDCKPEHLAQFARMGSIFVARVFHREAPVVGLMNIGEEPGKGNELAKAAFDLLSADETIRFKGNIEGRDVLQHAADVVVCDGFVGNIMLKLGESVATVLPHLIKQQIAAQQLPMEDALKVGGVVKAALAPFNYENFGGVPLLGVSGNVIIGHGSSNARAIAQMVLRGKDLVEQQVTASIAAALTDPATA